MSDAKPRGWGKFDALAKRLVKVPKDKVDDVIAAERAANIKQRKKKKER